MLTLVSIPISGGVVVIVW